MDMLLPLILMAIIFILPEIFKKGRNKKSGTEYEYPKIPDRIPDKRKSKTVQPQKQKTATSGQPGLGYEYYIPSPKAAQHEVFSFAAAEPVKNDAPPPAPAKTPVVTSGSSPWQGILSPQVLSNAFVFSEIIMPPRAYRPFGRHNSGKAR